jgi:hypothetical protein
MKDSEFIELLNLYLDHEISSEESARLEAEVASNADRLRLYRQYCRMQKACVVLADQHRENAPAQDAMAAAFAPRSVWSGAAGLWTTGLLAAAASISVIAVYRRPAAAPAGPVLAQHAPAAPAPAGSPLGVEFQPVFVARNLTQDGGASKADVVFTSAEPSGQFAWMDRVQIAPIQLAPDASLFVDPKPRLELDDRALSNRALAPDDIEQAAFQFHK